MWLLSCCYKAVVNIFRENSSQCFSFVKVTKEIVMWKAEQACGLWC